MLHHRLGLLIRVAGIQQNAVDMTGKKLTEMRNCFGANKLFAAFLTQN
jgi:hypothetical protein